MGSRSMLSGMEVPILSSDSIKWIDLSVSTTSATAITDAPSQPRDFASCFVIGDPPLYFIWRIHETHPHALELLQLSPHKEFPRVGLRLTFPHPLFPSAFISLNQSSSSSTNPYLLYALTVSGVAYLFRLRNLAAYSSCFSVPSDELIQFSLHNYLNNALITSVAATTGSLLVGRNDGSVSCFQLGLLQENAPGFALELRDDFGIGRLWGFVSRSRLVGSVQDLTVQEVLGLKLLFVLHSDGILRIWDLLSCSKILSYTMSTPTSEGAKSLWVGEANNNLSIIPFAILCELTSETRMEMIYIFNLHYTLGDKIVLSVESLKQNIPLEEGGHIDVKLTSEKIWILKDNELIFHNLLDTNNVVEEAHCYSLQEEFVAEQLFQSSELSSDDLLWIILSLFSSVKDQILPIVSSIFLHRLLHPGIYQSTVLRLTLLDYDRHLTDTEFQSLTADGLMKEIRALIEHEIVNESPTSLFRNWKNLCTRYFHYWCKNNSPCGLLVQSAAGIIGLIRKNSVSLFRDLENIEQLSDGPSDELIELISSRMDLHDDSEHEILPEVLKCIINRSQQLGKTAAALYYESLVNTPIISSEETIHHLLKILEIGYSSSMQLRHMPGLGGDFALEKEVADHKNLRKFSIDMLLSLHALSKKAGSWSKVLNVIESYLQFLVPQKIMQNINAEMLFNIHTSILVQATSQIAKVMFESALDVLLFVNYLLHISGQINMLHDDIARVQLELVPMVQDIVFEWLIIYFLATTPSQSPPIDDFSSQLSLLQIDSNNDKRSWDEKLGKCDFMLASIILLSIRTSSGELNHSSSLCLLSPQDIVSSVRDFSSWIIWGKTGEESASFLRRSTELALILLKHGQYDAVEFILTLVESNSLREKISKSIQDNEGHWCVLQHLLGCCLLAQARFGFNAKLKERKVCEAIRCFFRASSGQGACGALRDLSRDAGLPYIDFVGSVSSAAWKLHYYQWAMQLFEQYNISEGACQFGLAALEQVDEAVSPNDDVNGKDILNESTTAIKGRLWANVFKFTLDVNHLHDAYCAILSNPDDESKYICLRRFIIVLYEQGALKVLCDGQLPFIGLAEKIERELAWKADRSDILTKPNPYKLLYAFEMHRHNWRRAASYIYQYSVRLRSEGALKDPQYISLILQERLNALSSAINALHLVQPAYAWIEPLHGKISLQSEGYPIKKARRTEKENLNGTDIRPQAQGPQCYIDVEKLDNEFVLTSAEYFLSLASVRWTFTEAQKASSDLVDLLVETNLHDMAFTVIFKFWKGSRLKRELERVFCAMSLKCCPNKLDSKSGTSDLLLTSSMEEMVVHGSPDIGCTSQQTKGNTQWETLELYIEKYKAFHAGLPIIVAETLLRSDTQIELPLWLVQMFKNPKDMSWGMSGQESNPASLLRLYVNYGRYTEATNLILEYVESFALVRPSDLINRKRPSAVWFPYTTIERLWCQLEELVNSGLMVDQCDKLRKLLHGALLKHLELVKVDSEDAISSAAC